MAEAAERGLPASKPFGDSENFDVVVGRPGKFVAVQVKCTVFPSKNGEGYLCSVCSSHKIYKPGAFDFLAAYVVPVDVWYILPMREIEGMRSVSLCTPTGRYEKYREAWELLREAVGTCSDEPREEEFVDASLSQGARKDGAAESEDEAGFEDGIGSVDADDGFDAGAREGEAGAEVKKPVAKVEEPVRFHPSSPFGRMEAAMNRVRDQMMKRHLLPPEDKGA